MLRGKGEAQMCIFRRMMSTCGNGTIWNGEERGMVLEANGKGRWAVSFAGNCKVTVTLEDKGKAVLLSLTQDTIPTDDAHKLKIHYGYGNG